VGVGRRITSISDKFYNLAKKLKEKSKIFVNTICVTSYNPIQLICRVVQKALRKHKLKTKTKFE